MTRCLVPTPADAEAAGQDDGGLEDSTGYRLCRILGSDARVFCWVRLATPIRLGLLFLPPTNLTFGLLIPRGELPGVPAEPSRGRSEPGPYIESALAMYSSGPIGDDILTHGDLGLRGFVDRVAGTQVTEER